MIDIPNFRTDRRAELEQQLLKMTAERFKLARYLLETKDWDLFTMVEMGSDRLHHAFLAVLGQNTSVRMNRTRHSQRQCGTTIALLMPNSERR